ncbi:putative FBD-associated F-box protein At1g05080 [Humulus lupulus]|uniref:putative FBD-associated F-box protein At1g05080 n=1 Tax=Humulus lupulus TaxID=3486 RepID=UPI002B414C5E|nr:putative FBD-associated F-box protein At1g05080 [Humulus lupulus]
MVHLKKAKAIIEGRDKISDLPTFILHNILSLLPREDATRTCVLSKKWNCFSKFEFDERIFTEEVSSLTPEYLLKFCNFINVVDKSLRRFFHHQKAIHNNDKLIIQRFVLSVDIPSVDCTDALVSLVDEWIESVMDNGIRHLSLMVSIDYRPYYSLPKNTFQGKSINKFSFLERLALNSVYISDKIIRDITRNCPNIEFLSLYSCYGLKSIDISNLSKLKFCEVADNREHLSRVNINAPNLSTFSLEYFYQPPPPSDDPRLCCEMSLSCHNLKSLTLSQCSISDHTLHSNLSRLPLLESLNIDDCYMLCTIRISAPQLKSIRLCGRDNIKTINIIDAPSLSSFEYVAYNTNKNPLVFFSKSLQCPMEVVYEIDQYKKLDNSWFLKIREFLQVFCTDQSKTFQPYFKDCEVGFNLKELQEVGIPPPVKIENLGLKCLRVEESSTYCSSLFDGLLWSYHPKKISISSDSIPQRNCAKILYEKLVLARATRSKCCNSLNRKCWRHELKSVSMEISQWTEFEDEPRLLYWDQLPRTWPVLGDFGQVFFHLVWD